MQCWPICVLLGARRAVFLRECSQPAGERWDSAVEYLLSVRELRLIDNAVQHNCVLIIYLLDVSVPERGASKSPTVTETGFVCSFW